MKTMRLASLFVVLALIGSAQAAIYSEEFTTDPGWTYQGDRDPASIVWEDNATHGGILNARLYRHLQDISWCYTSDLETVMGRTVNETWDWTLSFDLYQQAQYKVYTHYGLVSDTFR